MELRPEIPKPDTAYHISPGSTTEQWQIISSGEKGSYCQAEAEMLNTSIFLFVSKAKLTLLNGWKAHLGELVELGRESRSDWSMANLYSHKMGRDKLDGSGALSVIAWTCKGAAKERQELMEMETEQTARKRYGMMAFRATCEMTSSTALNQMQLPSNSVLCIFLAHFSHHPIQEHVSHCNLLKSSLDKACMHAAFQPGSILGGMQMLTPLPAPFFSPSHYYCKALHICK